LRGLGQPLQIDLGNLPVPSQGTGNTSVLQAVEAGLDLIPGVGPILSSVAEIFGHGGLSRIEQWLGIGVGRREADLIVPFQNQLMASFSPITAAILINKPTPTVPVLDSYYRQVWMSGVAFTEFCLLKTFVDRRASGQALNAIMPYIDGSGGYVPDDGAGHALHGIGAQAAPTTFDSLRWGDGTQGGPGTNGIMGCLARMMQAQGASPPDLPLIYQAANQGLAVPVTPGGAPKPTGTGPGGVSICIPGTLIPAGCTPGPATGAPALSPLSTWNPLLLAAIVFAFVYEKGAR
jgi:hypothetical protein